jgi:hypothetical protein
MKKLDGLDEAIMGMVSAMIEGERINTLVYSGNKIHDILQKRDGMEWDEALDFIDFNIEGMYIGKDTPLVMWDLPYDWEEMDL